MPRIKQGGSSAASNVDTVKKLKAQIDNLEQKLQDLEYEKRTPRHSEDGVTLSKDKMIELLGILTHCFQKDAKPHDSIPTPTPPSSEPRPLPWRRFTTLV